jgi:hypothetical protein
VLCGGSGVVFGVLGRYFFVYQVSALKWQPAVITKGLTRC